MLECPYPPPNISCPQVPETQGAAWFLQGSGSLLITRPEKVQWDLKGLLTFSPEQVWSSGFPTLFALVTKLSLKQSSSIPNPKAKGASKHPKPKRKPFPKAEIMVPVPFLVLDFRCSCYESLPPPNFEKFAFTLGARKNVPFSPFFSWRIMDLPLSPLFNLFPFLRSVP